MSEILSEAEVDAMALCGAGWLSEKSLDRLIASHRQLRAERDALTAELAEAVAIAEEIGPLVYDSLYLQVRNSQEAKEFMLRDPRFQKAAQFLEKREAQP